MNVKITKEQHLELKSLTIDEYIFGSQLHGIANENSDKDYIRIISDSFYERLHTYARFLPNFHSFQYDDVENKTQYIYMTQTQFYKNLFSGDGNMCADVVLLSGCFPNPLFLCRSYKIIKGYIGVAKRDLKLHGNQEKKRFHAFRSLMMAEKLMNNELPTVKDIVNLKNMELPNKDTLNEKERVLREELNKMLDNGKITLYPTFKEKDTLADIMVQSNQIREFKY